MMTRFKGNMVVTKYLIYVHTYIQFGRECPMIRIIDLSYKMYQTN